MIINCCFCLKNYRIVYLQGSLYVTKYKTSVNRESDSNFILFDSKASGLGRLKPNTMILGFINNWKDGEMKDVETYINTIQ